MDGWLNPTVPDQAAFDERVRQVCQLYEKAPTLAEEGIQVVSTDEKTGIQATERLRPDKPMLPGSPVKREFEYVRHGTQSLIAGLDIVTGKIVDKAVGDTRTEEDFTAHVERLIPAEPEKKVIIVADQLNTHVSEGVVRAVAKACDIPQETLGKKGKTGVLRSMETRREFLENPEHRVRFVFTPKHCSWLNQIEIWFGILSRRILRRGSFSSVKALKERIERFIAYFNEHWAKPFAWTYKGKLLKA